VEGASASGLGKFQQQQRPHQQTLASDLRDIRQEQLNLQRRFGFSREGCWGGAEVQHLRTH